MMYKLTIHIRSSREHLDRITLENCLKFPLYSEYKAHRLGAILHILKVFGVQRGTLSRTEIRQELKKYGYFLGAINRHNKHFDTFYTIKQG